MARGPRRFQTFAPKKQHVYVLFHETNTGSASDESDGYVEGVYGTEPAAEEAQAEAIKKAIKEGKAVYFNPETSVETIDWTDDWRIEKHEVR